MNQKNYRTKIREILKIHWRIFVNENVHVSNDYDLLNCFKFVILSLVFQNFVNNYSKNHHYQLDFCLWMEYFNYFNDVFYYNKIKLSKENQCLSIDHIQPDGEKIFSSIIIHECTIQNIWDDISKENFLLHDRRLIQLYDECLELGINSKVRKKDKGIFYTPVQISHVMSLQAIDTCLINNRLEDIIILESSFGIGNFLLSCLEIIINKHRSTQVNKDELEKVVLRFIRNQLYGFEIDPFAIIIAKLRILIKLFEYGIQIDVSKEFLVGLFANITNGDFLFSNMTLRPTLIIGNPPWGNVKESEYKKQLKNKFIYLKGQVDQYRLFIEASIKLQPDVLCLITPDTWIEIPRGKTLKKYFFGERYFSSIFLLPRETFLISTHFFGFIAEKIQESVSMYEMDIQEFNSDLILSETSTRAMSPEEMRNFSIKKYMLLENKLLNINNSIKDSENAIKLGTIIDATIGYQLYHNTLHGVEEITRRSYHSKTKINNEWVREITSKNVKQFSIDYTYSSYVKKTALFFRIPPKRFLVKDKLLLREISSKNGFVIAYDSEEILFPKTIISIILKEDNTNDRLLIIMGYLMSYICYFDFLLNGVKASRKIFPRISLASLKNLNFNVKMFDTGIQEQVKEILYLNQNLEMKKGFNDIYALLQAKVFLLWNFAPIEATMIMNYLKISKSMQNNIQNYMQQLTNNIG